MKLHLLIAYCSFILVFIGNTAMIAPNTNVLDTRSNIETAPIQKLKKKPSKRMKKRFKRFYKKIKKKVKKWRSTFSAIDGPTLVWAIGAIILGGLIVYYFFKLGFLTGVIAIIAVAFFLYLLFNYLGY